MLHSCQQLVGGTAGAQSPGDANARSARRRCTRSGLAGRKNTAEIASVEEEAAHGWWWRGRPSCRRGQLGGCSGSEAWSSCLALRAHCWRLPEREGSQVLGRCLGPLPPRWVLCSCSEPLSPGGAVTRSAHSLSPRASVQTPSLVYAVDSLMLTSWPAAPTPAR